jgi:hypothetical protein
MYSCSAGIVWTFPNSSCDHARTCTTLCWPFCPGGVTHARRPASIEKPRSAATAGRGVSFGSTIPPAASRTTSWSVPTLGSAGSAIQIASRVPLGSKVAAKAEGTSATSSVREPAGPTGGAGAGDGGADAAEDALADAVADAAGVADSPGRGDAVGRVEGGGSAPTGGPDQRSSTRLPAPSRHPLADSSGTRVPDQYTASRPEGSTVGSQTSGVEKSVEVRVRGSKRNEMG